MENLTIIWGKTKEYLWLIPFFLLIGGGFYLGFQDHPWITSIIGGVVILFCIFVYLIFKGWDESENTIANDIRDRYGERKPHEGSHFLFKCKPFMPMVERSTSEKVLGFKVPEYEIIDSYGMPPDFNGDYTEVVELKFKQPLSLDILNQLEVLSQQPKSNWEKKGEEYILTLDKIDLDNKNDHYHTISITPEEMIISEGRV